MFTGIVEERGTVLEAAGERLMVACRTVLADTDIGSSLAVNGVCLTVVVKGDDRVGFDLSRETLDRSSLGRLGAGDPVNLERPVSLAARLGGHLVQGHVDGVGEVTAMEPDGLGGTVLSLRIPDALRRYVVEKGSIAVDGVSLTVAAIDGDGVRVALIPHTLSATTFGSRSPGDPVDLEVDVIARYVERLMEER